MKIGKKLSALVIFSALVAGLSLNLSADDKKPAQTTAQYLEDLQTRLDHAAQRANKPSSEGSSVVGLRGSAQESASKQLYWKGRKGKEVVSTDEVKDFRAAVEQARAGKNSDAILSLKAFQGKYPKSAFNPDVEETLARLSETPKQ